MSSISEKVVEKFPHPQGRLRALEFCVPKYSNIINRSTQSTLIVDIRPIELIHSWGAIPCYYND